MCSRTTGSGANHHFVVVIPVADRPRHLECALASLLTQCGRFGYGGTHDGRFRKVSVLVADDSADDNARARHRALCRDLDDRGITTHYFGPAEQWTLVSTLGETRKRLCGALGTASPDAFWHKGPSVTRNIAYLKLREMGATLEQPLFWFVDSDQEFRVADGEPGAIDYFRHLDEIFTRTGAEVLTGKVVGDPPVSPTVMAGTLLDDAIAFLDRISILPPNQPCTFHGSGGNAGDGAIYHDMADLFGFTPASVQAYECTLAGAHDHAACLAAFSERLARFFDGEHPTRATRYQPGDALQSVRPARTVYTGNYVITPAALACFIPFADLRLRMAGPVLGRLLRQALGERFVSANLPLMHRRTVTTTGRAEFRPGVRHETGGIDLRGEFERQYFGDVVLFAIERLSDCGWPDAAVTEAIAAVVRTVDEEMYRRYRERMAATITRLEQLRSLYREPGRWWHRITKRVAIDERMNTFMDDLARNFGDGAAAWHNIAPGARKEAHLERIVSAIAAYPESRRAWREALTVVSVN